MAKRSKKSRAPASARPPIGGARIAAAGLVGLIGAALAFMLAVSGVTHFTNPTVAAEFMPLDGLAQANRAEKLLLANPQNPPEETRTLALDALAKLPVNPKALRVLAYYEAAQGSEKRARDYIRFAVAQSRRDTLTQLWLIEAAVQKGNVREALSHYDTILRVSPDMRTTLFPILLNALNDRGIRTALRPYIRADRDWAQAFLVHAIANTNNLPALVDLRIESGGLPDQATSRQADIDLFQRLLKDKLYMEVRRLYLNLPGARPERLVDPAIDVDDRDGRFGPIGWQLISEADYGGSFVNAGSDRVGFSIFASAGTTATAASRLLFLAPGDYTFTARLSQIRARQDGFLRWQLRCVKITGDQQVWVMDGNSQAPTASVSVPTDCPVQFLDLIASGGSDEEGLQATIDRTGLRPTK